MLLHIARIAVIAVAIAVAIAAIAVTSGESIYFFAFVVPLVINTCAYLSEGLRGIINRECTFEF